MPGDELKIAIALRGDGLGCLARLGVGARVRFSGLQLTSRLLSFHAVRLRLRLRRRGDLTLWLDEAALAGWAAPKRITPGGQPVYADLAIELVLTRRLVFHLALRQAEAFARSVLKLLELDLSVLDHSTLMWTAVERLT